MENPALEKVLADQGIRLNSKYGIDGYPDGLRRVHHRDPETSQEYVFLSNLFDLSAQVSADLCRQRGQFELFFKWVKKDLKIKTFSGASRNAVLIQLWTALLAYLLLTWLKFKSTISIGILELTRLFKTMSMERHSLWESDCPKELLRLRPITKYPYSISLPDTK